MLKATYFLVVGVILFSAAGACSASGPGSDEGGASGGVSGDGDNGGDGDGVGDGDGDTSGDGDGSGGGSGDGDGDASSSGGSTPIDMNPGSYALPPPNQCHNQFYVQGCEAGNAASTCGGVCSSVNACQDEGKQGEPGFLCPRFMLFSDEMAMAASDDATRYSWPASNGSPFQYAVVGHDTDQEAGSVDDPGKSPCCQCYQLIPYEPENQVKNQQTQEPTVPLPKPLIVQAFNTGATTKTFDIFMGAGGLGAFDACRPSASGPGQQYTSYPSAGQPNGGGVKAVGEFGNGTACKTQENLVTQTTLESSGCQTLIQSNCEQIVSEYPAITEVSQRSCIDSNQPSTLYHMNWHVYVKRVKCPVALTEVTGCKLIEPDLPLPDVGVLTPQAAAADSTFKSGYSTTTMQDCCKPSCGWQDLVTGTSGGHQATGLYNSFYTCGKDGIPWTE
jgi:hypothetical protein